MASSTSIVTFVGGKGIRKNVDAVQVENRVFPKGVPVEISDADFNTVLERLGTQNVDLYEWKKETATKARAAEAEKFVEKTTLPTPAPTETQSDGK